MQSCSEAVFIEWVGPTLRKAKGFSVYDVPADMVGIEALLGAGQRLDPRLSHKAAAEAAG